MRLTPILTAAIAFVSLLPAPIASQSAAWATFLPGTARAEFTAAVVAVEADWADAPAARRARYDELQGRYVTAREERLDPDEYARLLRDAARGEDAGSDDAPDPRAVIPRVLGEDLPVPGSRSFLLAREWLSTLADREGLPVERFEAALGRIDEEYVDLLSVGDAIRFVGALDVPRGTLTEMLAPQDTAREVLALWGLGVLAAEDPQRIGMLRDLIGAMEEISGRASEPFVGELSSIRRELEQLVGLHSLLPLAPPSLSLVSPYGFADPSILSRYPDAFDRLKRVLFAVAAAETSVSAVPYRSEADLAFVVDTVHSLYQALSDLQRFALAEAMGVAHDELRHRVSLLYRLRVEAARLPVPDAAAGAPAPAPGSEFSVFLAEGLRYLDDAGPWAEGDRSRSGDSYRWAVLPILSHPYAQYTLATSPQLVETRRMVESFVSQTYETALRVSDVRGDSIESIVLGDAIEPFARVYGVTRRADAASLYRAFAAAAQGVDRLGDDFAFAYAAGLSIAGYWSHMHAFHVAVIAETGSDGADPGALVRARVDDWFALARVSDTAAEEISLTARGLIALRRVLLEQLQSVVASNSVAAMTVYERRLPTALALLEQAATFAADPVVVHDTLSHLYASGREGGAVADDRTTDLIAADMARLVTRLRDVEIADQRLVGRLAREVVR